MLFALTLGAAIPFVPAATQVKAWAQEETPAVQEESQLSVQDAVQPDEGAGAGSPAQPATGWVERDGARYYLGEGGEPRTGWLLDGGSWYWLDPSTGAMATGWVATGGAWYWLDPATGAMATGRAECGGAWSDFSASGAWLGYSSGWDLRDGSWHWLEGGRRATGWRRVGGSWYWMDPSTGAMRTGLAEIGSYRYYLTASGAMATGWARDASEGCWYYASPDGNLLTGWQPVGGSWYWMDGATARMQTGWLTVGGKTYHLSSSGAMDASCWIDGTAGESCWIGGDGVLSATVKGDDVRLAGGSKPEDGLSKVGDAWFYLVGGKIRRGSVTIDGVAHLFDETTGRAVTGWHVDADGVRRHYDEKGAVQTGWVGDGGWFYLDSDGAVTTGWKVIDGRWYHFDSGDGKMQTGWLLDNGRWYWLENSGAMATGWVWTGGAWYYMDADGSMHTGWLNLGGTWYYLASSGAMQTGWVYDGSAYYFCASDGHWVPTNAEYRYMLNWAQGYSSATNYLILVDTVNCRVGIYYGSYGSWTVTKEFICSPGAPSTPTVKGQFTVQDKGYVFGHGYSCYYYTQFYNDYLFHSVLYNEGTRVIQDGRLGQHLSHGCVRLAIENAKWIYDNIPRGTKVVIW